MKHLLDVNVLLAAIWANHSRHAETFAWLSGRNLVVCPLGELGFLGESMGSDLYIGQLLKAIEWAEVETTGLEPCSPNPRRATPRAPTSAGPLLRTKV